MYGRIGEALQVLQRARRRQHAQRHAVAREDLLIFLRGKPESAVLRSRGDRQSIGRCGLDDTDGHPDHNGADNHQYADGDGQVEPRDDNVIGGVTGSRLIWISILRKHVHPLIEANLDKPPA
jgi:hypothetical protein